jgi:nucleoside phosphorylase
MPSGIKSASVDFSVTPDGQHAAEIGRLCDAMEAADRAGRYPRLTVERPWSAHNPVLPLSVPVVSNHTLNTLLLGEVTARRLRSRMGIVHTTANRNWELHLALVEDRLRQSRALAVDMESATVAANGFRYRIPTATLLAVSDKPLHAQPKLSADAQNFYAASRRQHVEIAISVAEKIRHLYPGGLPAVGLRSPDEPLLGTTDPQPTQPQSLDNVTPDRADEEDPHHSPLIRRRPDQH